MCDPRCEKIKADFFKFLFLCINNHSSSKFENWRKKNIRDKVRWISRIFLCEIHSRLIFIAERSAWNFFSLKFYDRGKLLFLGNSLTSMLVIKGCLFSIGSSWASPCEKDQEENQFSQELSDPHRELRMSRKIGLDFHENFQVSKSIPIVSSRISWAWRWNRGRKDFHTSYEVVRESCLNHEEVSPNLLIVSLHFVCSFNVIHSVMSRSQLEVLSMS